MQLQRSTKKPNINKGFHRYFNRAQQINSANKGSLHQWLQGIFFAMSAWNAGPEDGSDIAKYVVDIGRELPYTI